ncbi:MAG: hypothetical protein FGF51_02480 [Candidatus Brockarchaeota archaeon]|nr:hypothetical protein [Candidatus Brockarchaeota archaeon]
MAKNRPDTVIAFKSLATDYFSDMPLGEETSLFKASWLVKGSLSVGCFY